MSNRVRRTIRQYNKIANEYAKKIEDRVFLEEINKFINLLELKPQVLDLGCAAGRDAKALTDRGIDVIAVDLSEKLLAIAKRKYPNIKFRKADIRALPFPSDSFDGIWASAVFHHLDKKEMIPTLKEWKRVLKENGIMYLSTKVGRGNWQGKDELSLGEKIVFTLLTKEELHKMLTRVGFRKIELTVKKDSTRDLYWLQGFYKK